MRLRMLLLVPAVSLLAGCGGTDDETKVRRTLSAFQRATAEKDYQALCDEILSKSLVDQVRGSGLPCELALKTGLEDRERPRVLVRSVRVRDESAFAEVRTSAEGEEPANEIIRLVREDDDWRISSLAARGPERDGSQEPIPPED